jgi:hypothetical protein
MEAYSLKFIVQILYFITELAIWFHLLTSTAPYIADSS